MGEAISATVHQMIHIIWTILYGSYLIDRIISRYHMVHIICDIWHVKKTSCESVLLLLSIECISIVMITFPFSQNYLYLQNWEFFVVKDSIYCLYNSSRPKMHLFDNRCKTYFNLAHFHQILYCTFERNQHLPIDNSFVSKAQMISKVSKIINKALLHQKWAEFL